MNQKEIKYNKVIELKDAQYPLWDLEEKNPKRDYTDTIAISDKYIQFYSPIPRDKNTKKRSMITLDRDDTITGYTNNLDRPLWRVEKNWATGGITLWPSIIWNGSSPESKQHFWFRDMKAIVLGDSWIFST